MYLQNERVSAEDVTKLPQNKSTKYSDVCESLKHRKYSICDYDCYYSYHDFLRGLTEDEFNEELKDLSATNQYIKKCYRMRML